MVGQGRGYNIIVPADQDQEAGILADLDRSARQVRGRLKYAKWCQGLNDRDFFHNRDIPAIALFWEDPECVRVPEDTPDTIRAGKLQAADCIAALTLWPWQMSKQRCTVEANATPVFDPLATELSSAAHKGLGLLRVRADWPNPSDCV